MEFKNLLAESHMTQMELAKKLGKSQRLISSWCNNESQPRLAEVLRLSEIFNVDCKVILNCFVE